MKKAEIHLSSGHGWLTCLSQSSAVRLLVLHKSSLYPCVRIGTYVVELMFTQEKQTTYIKGSSVYRVR